MPVPRSPGRPRLASRELLQEAAFELFQLKGYRATSVEQIARTAGFSRATFFNCFSSKAELFWLGTDALLARLRDHLQARLAGKDAPSLNEAMLEYAGELRSAEVPWALQNLELIGAADDLVASGAGRVLELAGMLRRYAERRGERLASEPGDAALLRASAEREAAILTALLLTALRAWIDAGVGRGTLHDHLAPALLDP